MPNQKVYTSEPPPCYTAQHMFIGATLVINDFLFILIDADEYALRFMELNAGQVNIDPHQLLLPTLPPNDSKPLLTHIL